MNSVQTKSLVLSLGQRTHLIPQNVSYLEAEGNYTNVYSTKGGKRLLSTTLKIVLEQFQLYGNFVRISRKHAVNMHHVSMVSDKGVSLHSGQDLLPSRRMAKNLDKY